MDVSIIIVTYNTIKLTKECIESIIKHTTGINFEIILIDNNSKDGSRDVFEHDNRIKYIYSHKNLGFGKANNLGAKSASGKYLLFLNSDTLLISNAVRNFYESLEENPKIGVMGGQLLWPNNTIQESYFSFPTLWLLLKDCLGLINHTPKYCDNNKSIICLKDKFISGADLFISHQLFDKIGGFYPKFFMYYEETDLQYQIKKYNLSIAFNPNIRIIHYNGGSQNNNNPQDVKRKYCKKIAIFNKSRIIFFRHNKPKKLFLVKSILTLGILLRASRLFGYIRDLIKNIWEE